MRDTEIEDTTHAPGRWVWVSDMTISEIIEAIGEIEAYGCSCDGGSEAETLERLRIELVARSLP